MAEPLVPFEIRLRIRERRRALGLTQPAVYKALGLRRTSYYNLERGILFPTVEQLVRLAQILDVTPWWELLELVPLPDASVADRQCLQALQLMPSARKAAAQSRRTETRGIRQEAWTLTDASLP